MAAQITEGTTLLTDQQTDVPVAQDATATRPRPRRAEARSTRAPQGRVATDRGGEPAGGKSPSSALTPRQLEVLALLTDGMTNRHIARALGITEKTVKNHMHAIFARLNVSDRTQAAVYAVRHNRAA
ncbi:response regulator transcription factor [Kitasatospora sp. NBC_00240]|uniref:response regulator transcription factor n=1 Tax=Kitasatospora sp. NBC_00240 TaxID=2903567 RepID=UPI00224F83DF|nr:response regulator transcription factor [Kitasatospora sp. NBC_00240]MCX5213317.1 response regulator transcription factor [Kitasatospora sp. NBC_00240]